MENVLARPPRSQKIPAQVGNVFIASKLPGKLTSGKYLKQDKFDNGRRALGTIENVDENAGQLEKLKENDPILAIIRSFRRFETRLQSFDNRLRVIEDKECEPYPFELDAHRDSIVEQEFIGGTKRSEQSDLLEDIMVNREEYAAVVEEREKYKKEAEENWQIVKELEGILMEKNEEIEYLQGQLSKADNEC